MTGNIIIFTTSLCQVTKTVVMEGWIELENFLEYLSSEHFVMPRNRIDEPFRKSQDQDVFRDKRPAIQQKRHRLPASYR